MCDNVGFTTREGGNAEVVTGFIKIVLRFTDSTEILSYKTKNGQYILKSVLKFLLKVG